MAIKNFIPSVWSESLYKSLARQHIAAAHCNRTYEGDIRQKGNSVKICGVSNITVSDYEKNTNMNDPQTLGDLARELVINQAKYFNFQIDDIDHTQANPGLMELAIKKAAHALANEADKYIFSLYNDAGISHHLVTKSGTEIIQSILKMKTMMMEYDVMEPSDLVIEVSPAIAKLLLETKSEMVTDNSEQIERGCIGSIYGSKVYISNNIAQEKTDVGNMAYHCLIRSKRAIAYAEQLSEIEAYRPELRFADAVKGLLLYGAKVVYPAEIVDLKIELGSPSDYDGYEEPVPEEDPEEYPEE